MTHTRTHGIRGLGLRHAVFAAVVAAGCFSAGYLVAGSKEDPSAPQERFLMPEGFELETIYPNGSTIIIRAKETATGATHLFVYSDGKGDQKIRWHSVVGVVPAAEAFKN